MYSRVVTQTASNSVGPVYFDDTLTPFNVSIGCIASGEINFSIQHTFDDLFFLSPASATWFNSDLTSLVSASTNVDGNYAYAVRAAKVVVNSGTGSVKVTFTQAGSPRG